MSYVITPDMFRQGLEKIEVAAGAAARTFERGFATSHLLFTCIGDTYEKALDTATVTLSKRYAWTSARPPSAIARWARRKASSKPPEVPRSRRAHIHSRFRRPLRGARQQIERFAAEAMPLLAGLRAKK